MKLGMLDFTKFVNLLERKAFTEKKVANSQPW